MSIKETLNEIVKSLPADREYADMRYYVLKAISEADNIEKKRKQKAKLIEMQKGTAQVSQQWQMNPQTGTLSSPFELKQKLNVIDEMIAAEKQAIENMHKKPKKQETPQEETDSDMLNG